MRFCCMLNGIAVKVTARPAPNWKPFWQSETVRRNMFGGRASFC